MNYCRPILVSFLILFFLGALGRPERRRRKKKGEFSLLLLASKQASNNPRERKSLQTTKQLFLRPTFSEEIDRPCETRNFLTFFQNFFSGKRNPV